jgi:hypothetical protein
MYATIDSYHNMYKEEKEEKEYFSEIDCILFTTSCIYDKEINLTKLYGQSKKHVSRIVMTDSTYTNEITCIRNHPDFLLLCKGKPDVIPSITIYFQDGSTFEKINIVLDYPFINVPSSITKESVIISTMCKNYSHRLEEWIKYNIKLGISGIVVFDNSDSIEPLLNEEGIYNVKTTKDICDAYKYYVVRVCYPYTPINGMHWNNIQRISLHIGVNAFKNNCSHIALIDPDEFIYLPQKEPSITDFLQKYNSSITMKSNIVTNKNNYDYIDNNILQLDLYIGEDKYTKTILRTDLIRENEFILTPHTHPTQLILEKNVIIHYHTWMNNRYQYNESMPKITI